MRTFSNDESLNLTDDQVIDLVNERGGLIHAMAGDLHHSHIKNKKLAKCFCAAYRAGQEAQSLLSKANDKRSKHRKLLIGIVINGHTY